MATKAARRPKPRRIDGGEQSPQSTKPLLLPTTNGCPRRPTDSPGRRFSLRRNHRFSRERRKNFHPAEDPTIIAAGITPAKRRRKIKEGERKGWRHRKLWSGNNEAGGGILLVAGKGANIYPGPCGKTRG